MRVLRLAFLLTLCGAHLLLAAGSWQHHTDRGELMFALGDLEAAEGEFEQALELAWDFPEGDIRIEKSLRNLARLYEHRSALDRAESNYLLLAAAQENRLGEGSPELLDTLAALARVAIPLGDYPVALDSLESYVKIADATGRADQQQLRIVLDLLARVYLHEDRGDEALVLQRRSSALAVADPGLDAEEQGAALESLAQLELQSGTPAAAEQALEQVVAVRRAGDPGAAAADVFIAGAGTAVGFGEFEAAVKLARRALTEAVDEDEVLAATGVWAQAAWMRVRRSSDSIADLVGAARDDPDLAEAAEALSALDELQSAEAGESSPGRLETLERLAAVAVMGGEVERAIALLRQVADVYRTTVGPGNPATRSTLRDILELSLLDPGRVAESLQANTELLAAEAEAWGEDDPRLLPTLQRQYDLLRAAKERKAARAVKKRIRALQ